MLSEEKDTDHDGFSDVEEIKLKNHKLGSIIYEISSWGQKYYILESEIDYYINFSSSPLFTNVLIVEENK